jgi:hypothetical protein
LIYLQKDEFNILTNVPLLYYNTIQITMFSRPIFDGVSEINDELDLAISAANAAAVQALKEHKELLFEKAARDFMNRLPYSISDSAEMYDDYFALLNEGVIDKFKIKGIEFRAIAERCRPSSLVDICKLPSVKTHYAPYTVDDILALMELAIRYDVKTDLVGFVEYIKDRLTELDADDSGRVFEKLAEPTYAQLAFCGMSCLLSYLVIDVSSAVLSPKLLKDYIANVKLYLTANINNGQKTFEPDFSCCLLSPESFNEILTALIDYFDPHCFTATDLGMFTPEQRNFVLAHHSLEEIIMQWSDSDKNWLNCTIHSWGDKTSVEKWLQLVSPDVAAAELVQLHQRNLISDAEFSDRYHRGIDMLKATNSPQKVRLQEKSILYALQKKMLPFLLNDKISQQREVFAWLLKHYPQELAARIDLLTTRSISRIFYQPESLKLFDKTALVKQYISDRFQQLNLLQDATAEQREALELLLITESGAVIEQIKNCLTAYEPSEADLPAYAHTMIYYWAHFSAEEKNDMSAEKITRIYQALYFNLMKYSATIFADEALLTQVNSNFIIALIQFLLNGGLSKQFPTSWYLQLTNRIFQIPVADFGIIKGTKFQQATSPTWFWCTLLKYLEINLVTKIYGNIHRKRTDVRIDDGVEDILTHACNIYPADRHYIWKMVGSQATDAGGVSRDYFSRLGDRIAKEMVEVDGYLMPRDGNECAKITRLIAKALIVDECVLGLKLHPIVYIHLLLNDRPMIPEYRILEYLIGVGWLELVAPVTHRTRNIDMLMGEMAIKYAPYMSAVKTMKTVFYDFVSNDQKKLLLASNTNVCFIPSQLEPLIRGSDTDVTMQLLRQSSKFEYFTGAHHGFVRPRLRRQDGQSLERPRSPSRARIIRENSPDNQPSARHGGLHIVRAPRVVQAVRGAPRIGNMNALQPNIRRIQFSEEHIDLLVDMGARDQDAAYQLAILQSMGIDTSQYPQQGAVAGEDDAEADEEEEEVPDEEEKVQPVEHVADGEESDGSSASARSIAERNADELMEAALAAAEADEVAFEGLPAEENYVNGIPVNDLAAFEGLPADDRAIDGLEWINAQDLIPAGVGLEEKAEADFKEELVVENNDSKEEMLHEEYRDALFAVLESYDSKKLETLYRFWFGTISPNLIRTPPRIIFRVADEDDKVKCATVSTCTNCITIPMPQNREVELIEWIAEVLERSLTNQAIAEEAQLRFQLV